MSDIIVKDLLNCKDILNIEHLGGPKRTEINIYEVDEKGNEILKETVQNKIVATGSIFNAINVFQIQSPFILPNYNEELDLENTLDYSEIQPYNTPCICLFCVSDEGCGTEPSEVFTANFIDRVDPKKIMPFRYVDPDDDLSEDLRKYYFGRKELIDENKIAYYFKAFSTTPQLNFKYADGTQVVPESMYSVDTSQAAEVWVETNLNISREDLRDYFDQVIGWENARVSTISLCYAWYADGLDPNNYRWYQQIIPMTKLNFSFRLLHDLTGSLRFNYRIYF